jgi:xylulokinase
MAFNNNGAVSLEWYRENFAKEYTIEELIEMAKDIEAGCNGLVAKPCVHNYNELSGFGNIQSIHKHGHFVRAILESTANSLNSLIKELKGTHFSGRVISTGGGAKSRPWVQIKASIANVDFYIPETNEAACLGAAMIGAVGAGKLGDWSEVTKKWIQYKEMIKPVSKEK